MKIKKTLIVILSVICCFMLVINVGCTSAQVKEAQEAYNQGDYTAALQALEGEDTESGKAKELSVLSKAHLYYNDKKYADAFNELLTINLTNKDDFYNQVVNDAIASSLNSGDTTEIIKMIKECTEVAEPAKETYYEAAEKLNIKAYQCIRGLANSDINDDSKKEFSDYLYTNQSNMQKSYVLGKWQRVNSADTTKDVIAVKQQENNFIGIYEIVGEESTKYQKKIGEIAWKDFKFMSDDTITFNVLGKTTSGIGVNSTAYVKIDYNNINSMTQMITPEASYWTSDPERIWQRIG